MKRRVFLSLAALSLPAISVAKGKSSKKVWKYQTQVLVVGGGFAGLSAAVAALRAGKKVILIDKRLWLGGDGALSSGIFYAADTELQKRAGIKNVSKEDYWKQICAGTDDEPLAKVRDNSRNSPVYFGVTKHNPDVLRRVSDNTTNVIKFISEYGIEFLPLNPAKPFQLPMLKKSVQQFPAKMIEEIREKGGQIFLNTKALKLITSDGSVIGVQAEQKNQTFNIKADAVILATGGFLDNDYLMKKYKGFWSAAPAAIAAVGEKRALDRTGDGIMMGREIGAALEDMESMPKLAGRMEVGLPFISWTIFDVEPAFFVSPKGKRMLDEHIGRYAGCSLALMREKEPYGFVVFGSETFNGKNKGRFNLEKGLQEGSIFRGDTPEELAKKVGIPPEEFSKTFNRFNHDATNGKDTEFGRKDPLFRPLTAPYYISTKGYPGAYKTEGGLEVNEHLQVLRAKDDKPIEGLYAAGSTCGSITARINDAVSSGLLAGKEAADSVK